MNKIVIDDIRVIENRLECTYSVSGEWKKYFLTPHTFIVEYSKSIDTVPPSVAVIPFLCNILPVAWILDGQVILENVDKDFYDSIDKFKQGFIDMYPALSFKGRIIPSKVTDNKHHDNSYKTAAFFSGGVDSFSTLISHIDETPILMTLWGADIPFEDQAGWNLVDNYIESIANDKKLDYVSIKTPLRRFLDEAGLSEYVVKETGNNWWYGFQHGVGVIGHAAPYVYQYNVKTIYIASSFTEEDRSTCASDPSIDNNVRFCGSRVIHDGFEYSRQDKVNRISEYVRRSGAPLNLRVCWESEGGSNCCNCEKCHLTILCLLAGKNDPREYGFSYRNDELANMMKDFRMEIHFTHPSCNILYHIIQEEMHKNYKVNDVDKSLKWYYKMDIEKELSPQKRIMYRFIRKAKRITRK
ncbi:MAG: hypothetical protein GX129_12725 [Clostridiales bacterium]|nr:hypothetical protein [Clostridiales bacterium]